MVVRENEHYGRAFETSTAVNLTVNFHQAALWRVTTTAAVQIRMPDATQYELGGRIGYIVLPTGSTTITIADNSGNAITLSDGGTTLAADEAVIMLLIDNSTVDGTWAGMVRSVSSATNPVPASLIYVSGGSRAGFTGDETEEFNQQLNTTTSENAAPTTHNRGGAFRTGTASGVWFGDNTHPADSDHADRFTPSTGLWAALSDINTGGWFDGQRQEGTSSSSLLYVGGDAVDMDGTIEFNNATPGWTLQTNKPTLTTNGTGSNDPSDADDMLVQSGLISGVRGLVHERYRGSTDVWTGLLSLPAPATQDHCACGHADGVLRVGGQSSVQETDVDDYVISGDAWVGKSEFPAAAPSDVVIRHAPMAAPEDDIFLMGGQTVSTVNDEIWAYNQLLDTWTQRTDLQDARTTCSQMGIAIEP